MISSLPDFDKPVYFGLPENVDGSRQRMVSSQIVSQLRILQRADVKANRFDKEAWARELGPILSLWKQLNQVCDYSAFCSFFAFLTPEQRFDLIFICFSEQLFLSSPLIVFLRCLNMSNILVIIVFDPIYIHC